MHKYTFLCLCLLVSGCSNEYFGGVQPEDIKNMYSSYVEEWKSECNVAFNEAEKEIFKDDIPIVIDETNPDPTKCICKGTGIIVQGDGHKTVCPYHGKSTSSPSTKR